MPSNSSPAVRPRPGAADPDDVVHGAFDDGEVVVEGEVDERPAASKPVGPAEHPSAQTAARKRRPGLIVEGRQPRVVSGRVPAGGRLAGITDYPVQMSKVQAPPLRDETLARDRLLDWLSVKIHRRAILLVAEAGYGKTTLLADFTRRTRLRVLWFRLDRGDRDWVGFIAHLVAALAIHMPEFGPSTRALLRETATTAPSLDTVLETFMRELAAVAGEPTALVFDDFHLVDDSADIRNIVRELLTRGPERMSFVFATRREPPIRLARLRALGEVAELSTDDLRFDPSETERLFRETYAMRLEPSLVAELGRRTEGWAASLQLVRAAIHDRDPGEVRSFISSLSGAEGHLYEYLAEEVIGELPDDLQQFLMRTSFLETVDLTLGPVAGEVSREEAARLIEEGERQGLLGKGSARQRHAARAHPLVRDFLQDRLRRSIGDAAIEELHLRVADAAASVDLLISARHYLEAGAHENAVNALTGALDDVIGKGGYAAAEELVGLLPGGVLPGVAGYVLQSRIAVQRGEVRQGLALAEAAEAEAPNSPAVLLGLLHARHIAGDVPGALAANQLLVGYGAPGVREIGETYEALMKASVSGSLVAAETALRNVASGFRRESKHHFAGVALLNLALVQIARGMAEEALSSADDATTLLAETSAGMEFVAARLARAEALAVLGRIDDARTEIDLAKARASDAQSLELAAEVGWLEALFGEAKKARTYVESRTVGVTAEEECGEQAIHARMLLRLADGEGEAASADLTQLRFGMPIGSMAFDAQRHFAHGLVLALLDQPGAGKVVERGRELARGQGAALWTAYGDVLSSFLNAGQDPSGAVLQAAAERPVVLSMLAEVIAPRLTDLSGAAFEALTVEIERMPWRWRASLRRAIRSPHGDGRLRAAQLLERIGELEDVASLRQFSRAIRGRGDMRLGYGLSRRLAPRILVEDLGRVRILRGPEVIEGSSVRRKVLGLLCLLLTKPRYVLTRDEVLDSLWPESDPGSALNSLNQTVYFLRRVFEPSYSEDSSPGYVGQDGETIWLDGELVDCASRRCIDLIRSMPAVPTPDGAIKLATLYRGRFAVDFTYEEWAEAYRDVLHASYLRVMEHAIRMDVDAGHFERGTFLAERAAEVDPDAEEIQLALARLYRQSGAHAAAAEQYGHYAKSMRELGVEPDPL